jgi:hypothetical protein
MPDNTIGASIAAQWRPRIVVRSGGPPLVIYTLDGITRITPMIVVPDEVWDTDRWASYRPNDSVSHTPDDSVSHTPDDSVSQGPDEGLAAESVPQWLSNPSSRAMAALMNERMLMGAEAEAIKTAIDDMRVMLAEGDYGAVDHLLDLIGETADAIVNTLNKPPPEDL